MPDRSSAEKKRDRDRRAQQNLRNKKLHHTAKLEVQVAHCEKYHNDNGVQNLLGVIEGLRKQNEILVARQKAMRSVVNSWDETFEVTGSSSSSMAVDTDNEKVGRSFPQEQYIPGINEPLDIIDHMARPEVPPTSTSPLEQTSRGHSIGITSPWNELPLYSDNFSSLQSVSLPWFANPDQIAQCPDTPESPLDILYGSKTNMLANMIHTAIERRPIRDPERLAAGWIMYHFSKWIIEPSPKTYEKLPSFIRPVQEQFQFEHPIAISGIPFPKLRSNLVPQWSLYENNRDDFFGLFACCIKIRWPWGVKILDRDEDNELRIKPSFYDTFMKEDGWGITQEFISKHPNLMVGIDVGSLVFNMT